MFLGVEGKVRPIISHDKSMTKAVQLPFFIFSLRFTTGCVFNYVLFHELLFSSTSYRSFRKMPNGSRQTHPETKKSMGRGFFIFHTILVELKDTPIFSSEIQSS
jgi:hypothetical protein